MAQILQFNCILRQLIDNSLFFNWFKFESHNLNRFDAMN